MSRIHRSLVVGSALAALALSAQAGPGISLNFEDIAATVPSQNGQNGVAVGSFFSSHGLTFSGATAFDFSQIPAGSTDLEQPPTGNGFISNIQGAPLIVAILPAFRLSFATLNFDLSATIPIDVAFQGSCGSAACLATLNAEGSNFYAWRNPNGTGPGGAIVIPSTVGELESITFAPQGSGLLALDNFSLLPADNNTGGGGGGAVPEPASFGLTALALFGAGLASRRRKA